MDWAISNGLTMRDMRALGSTIRHSVRVNSFTLMATYMMEIGVTTKQVASVSTLASKVPNTRGIGEKIVNTVKGLKRGLTVQSTKEITKWAR